MEKCTYRDETKDLIRSMLSFRPEDRPDAGQLLELLSNLSRKPISMAKMSLDLSKTCPARIGPALKQIQAELGMSG